MQTSNHEPGKVTPWKRALRLVLVALLVALFLRILVFEAFRIPSESMEETLLVGDFVFVSKLAFGPRLPGRLRIPFTRWSMGRSVPGPRLPGFTSVRHGDIVVFNAPAGYGPIEERRPTIKRVAGLPGDTIEMRDGDLFVNGEQVIAPASSLRLWEVHLNAGFAMPSEERMAAIGITGRVDRTGRRRLVEATRESAMRLQREPGVDEVSPLVRSAGEAEASFPAALHYGVDRYGPLVIPQRGATIPLTDSTWARYHDTIRRHEGVEVRRGARVFEINNAPADSFRFQQDYLFVLGDNRSASADSRTWGFVPMRHVIGRAALIYFSWNENSNHPRWDRIVKPIR